jgi:HK97 family phage major capsid protein
VFLTMSNPFEAGYAADPLQDLLTELREKGQIRAEKWQRFSEERDRLGAAGLIDGSDETATERLKELSEDYERTFAGMKSLENRLQGFGNGSARPNEPGFQEKAWSRTILRQLIDKKALDATTGGTIPPPYYEPQLRTPPAGNLFTRSVIPVIGASEGDRVSYLRQTTRTNNAATVAVGSSKPTSVFSVERVEVPFSVIAHVTEEVDRSLLMDYEQLQTFLDSELRLGVFLAEEDQILNGDGNFPNLQGILDAVTNDQPKGSDSISDAILRGLNVVRVEGLVEPDAIVMNSADFEDAVLEKASTAGTYLHGDPTNTPLPQLWGKRVVISPFMDQGTALVGSFATGAAIYDREQPRVDFTDGGDLFTKNQLVFRGEERVTLAIFRTDAFATVSGL